jgi:phosphoglycolate phosphatase
VQTTLIYDLDGTLVDSASTVASLLNTIRIERDMAPMPVETYKPWLSMGGKPMIAAAFDIHEDDGEATNLLDLFRSRYLAKPTDPGTVYPHVHTTLEQLRSGGIRLGLCTNKPRALTEKVLVETGLTPYFSVICAGNDLKTRKPHPNNLQFCLTALKSLATETVVVVDSRIDQCLAEACGASFAFFRPGYDDGVQLPATFCTIDDHVEMLDQLKKHS